MGVFHKNVTLKKKVLFITTYETGEIKINVLQTHRLLWVKEDVGQTDLHHE